MPRGHGYGLRVAVVGAGVAGLAAAQAVRHAGHTAVVFDKGRGPGGRATTRRTGRCGFDHGAQYFTVRDPRFARRVETWLAAGVVAEWRARLVVAKADGVRPIRGNDTRYVATPGMSALARHLASDLDTRQAVRVDSVDRVRDTWRLNTVPDGDHGRFDYLIVTAPPAQAVPLVGRISPLGERAQHFAMRPCWAAMLGFGAPLAVEYDGAFCEDAALSWIARDSSKPGRRRGEAWVLHAGPDWSEAHLNDEPDTVARALTEELVRLTGVELPHIEHRGAHRWRYALPAQPAAAGCLFDAERGLALAGDAYNGGRIEGAWLSGMAAAEHVLSSRDPGG